MCTSEGCDRVVSNSSFLAGYEFDLVNLIELQDEYRISDGKP